MTRPDIAYAVSTLSQYMESPHTTHLAAVKRIFAYLSGTKNLKLVLGGKEPGIIGFTDTNWASNLYRHSISGFVLFVSCGITSWSAKKQHQGGPKNRIIYPGSYFFLRPPWADLTTYVIRHISIYGNALSAAQTLSSPPHFTGIMNPISWCYLQQYTLKMILDKKYEFLFIIKLV
jgi:hypothetical protein